VLKDSTYRDNARQLQKAIAKANGLSVAADLIETTLGVTKKAGETWGDYGTPPRRADYPIVHPRAQSAPFHGALDNLSQITALMASPLMLKAVTVIVVRTKLQDNHNVFNAVEF
jgi:hypothetical protein